MTDIAHTPIEVRPFSFTDGWENTNRAEFPPVNFAEQEILRSDAFAKLFQKHGFTARKEELLERADQWRNIAVLPYKAAKPFENKYYAAALEAIGAMFTHARQGSKDAVDCIALLADFISSNLCSLIDHGENETKLQAASALVKSLTKSVTDFETLAKRNPNLFWHETEAAFGVPGFISPASEKVKDNAELVEKLKVGMKSVFYLPTGSKTGKTMKLVTGSNLWAARLVGYICLVKEDAERERHLRAAYEKGSGLGNDSINRFFYYLHRPEMPPGAYSPSWLQAAIDLAPFSSQSCPAWFEVAWMIVLDVTKGKPEKEPVLREIGKSGEKKPVGYRHVPLEGSKSSNVRNVAKASLHRAFKVLSTRDLPRSA